MNSPADLLEAARKSWLKAQDNYVAAVVEVGGALHEYVLARLREADGLGNRQRGNRGIAREVFVLDAANALGVSATTVNQIIQCAMCTQICGVGVSLTGLSFSRLRALSRLVVRQAARTKHWKPLCRQAGQARSSVEEWVLRKGVTAGAARGLFRRAVLTGLPADAIRREVHALADADGWRVTDKTRATARYLYQGTGRPDPKEDGPGALKMAKLAGPQDLASLIEDMVIHSRDPEITARLVCDRLANWRPVRERITF